MYNKEKTISTLLHALYDNVTCPDGWVPFLQQIAVHFDSPSATLRITDRENPVVHQSFATGLDQGLDYDHEAVIFDPFRASLANGPLGKVHTSSEIISDRAFEHCDHYQLFFRPNGNFYAMGTQFERDESSAMHIGIHRPRSRGMFTQQEKAQLEDLSGHFRRVVQLTRLTNQVQVALTQAHNAFNALSFGVWMLDSELRCQWHNRAAEDALTAHCFGLRQRNGQLTIDESTAGAALMQATRKLKKGESQCESVQLSASGASLILFGSRMAALPSSWKVGHHANIIVFLLDPHMTVPLDHTRLKNLYSLTAAEARLVDLLVRGFDVTEASAYLHVTTHTTRSQLKSIMQKTEVSRQPDLIRKLLLSGGLVNYE